MIEEEHKIRLLTAAARLQNIIATLKIDPEYQSLIDLYGCSIKTLRVEVQTLENANAVRQATQGATSQNQLDDSDDLLSSLNQAIHDMGKLVVQIDNNLNFTGLRH